MCLRSNANRDGKTKKKKEKEEEKKRRRKEKEEEERTEQSIQLSNVYCNVQ